MTACNNFFSIQGDKTRFRLLRSKRNFWQDNLSQGYFIGVYFVFYITKHKFMLYYVMLKLELRFGFGNWLMIKNLKNFNCDNNYDLYCTDLYGAVSQ